MERVAEQHEIHVRTPIAMFDRTSRLRRLLRALSSLRASRPQPGLGESRVLRVGAATIAFGSDNARCAVLRWCARPLPHSSPGPLKEASIASMPGQPMREEVQAHVMTLATDV